MWQEAPTHLALCGMLIVLMAGIVTTWLSSGPSVVWKPYRTRAISPPGNPVSLGSDMFEKASESRARAVSALRRARKE